MDETVGAALIAQANDILAAEDLDAFAERVRDAQAETAFSETIRFMTPKAITAAMDRDDDPSAPLSETDRGRWQTIARDILEARAQDPAESLMTDPTVANGFTDGSHPETALSRRLRAQMEIGIEAPKVLPRSEAGSLAAELNALPPAARFARLSELQQTHGKHHEAALDGLAARSLNRPTQAFATAQDNLTLALALIDAQTIGRAALRNELDPEKVYAVDIAIKQALDGVDTKGFRFVVEVLTFRAHRQTGGANLAVEDILALASEAFGLERSTLVRDETRVPLVRNGRPTRTL